MKEYLLAVESVHEHHMVFLGIIGGFTEDGAGSTFCSGSTRHGRLRSRASIYPKSPKILAEHLILKRTGLLIYL
jgi:hypothetical protein